MCPFCSPDGRRGLKRSPLASCARREPLLLPNSNRGIGGVINVMYYGAPNATSGQFSAHLDSEWPRWGPRGTNGRRDTRAEGGCAEPKYLAFFRPGFNPRAYEDRVWSFTGSTRLACARAQWHGRFWSDVTHGQLWPGHPPGQWTAGSMHHDPYFCCFNEERGSWGTEHQIARAPRAGGRPTIR